MKMRIQLTSLILFVLSSCTSFIEEPESPDKFVPSDHLYYQRAHPGETFDEKGWINTMHHIGSEVKSKRYARDKGLWKTQGPGNAGARINTIARNPRDSSTILIGYSAGGIYKTSNGGQTWKPVFDDFSMLAIGDIAFHPDRANVVYAGTGDPNISRIPFAGDGIYQSVDNGENWGRLGLQNVGIISEIIVDPHRPEVLYVASMGVPYYRDANRGLYKSDDSGASWTKVLYLGDSTGVIDIAIDPMDSRILYAAGWDRIRNYEESTTTGEGARIYKSVNGGVTWTTLQGGLPNGKHSRIGIDISPQNPDRLYAVYVDINHELEAVLTSADAGDSWSNINIGDQSGMGSAPFGGFGWYFGKIRVNPYNEMDVFVLGVRMWRWNSDLKRWSRADRATTDRVHADIHDINFLSREHFLLATDGGLYRSQNDAMDWTDIEDIPTTQFYRVAYNPHKPDMFYGGAQDNGSLFGNQEIINDWTHYFTGDGFRTIFHPENPLVYYVETQIGGFAVTTDGGESFQGATRGIDRSDFINWDAPVIMSRHNPDILYFGTDKVYKSTTGTEVSFEVISDLLIDDEVVLESNSNITAIAEGVFDGNILFAGTGDGNVYRTENGGQDWIKSDDGLPDRYVTSVHPSPDGDSTYYVTHSGFKAGEKLSYIHRSKDNGNQWVDISGNLPSLPVNDLYILPFNQDSVLFAGTDAGVYYTITSGELWLRLGNNLPVVPVFDLEYNPEQNLLIAGTHAKSIVTFNLHQLGLRGDLGTHTRERTVSRFEISPNPASTVIRLNLEKPANQIWVSDSSGKRVSLSLLSEHVYDVSNLTPGWYLVTAIHGVTISTSRFIKI